MSKSGLLRPKYGLRTLLILVAVVCLAVGFYTVGTRLREAERELKARREETGHLTIGDRTKVHVIALEADEPDTWRWRVFIPQGHQYSWNLAAEEIPAFDVPQQAQVEGHSNEPYWERDNEVLVTARLRKEDDQWRLAVTSRIGDAKHQMHGASMKIPAETMQQMADVSCTDGRVAGTAGVKIFDPKGPIILLQRRPCERQPDGTYGPSPNPMPGFMLWLKEE